VLFLRADGITDEDVR
jgi:hypothetical protein